MPVETLHQLLQAVGFELFTSWQHSFAIVQAIGFLHKCDSLLKPSSSGVAADKGSVHLDIWRVSTISVFLEDLLCSINCVAAQQAKNKHVKTGPLTVKPYFLGY